MTVESLRLITNDWNAVFRIDTTEGKRYVIRVCIPEFTPEETRSEMMWMSALNADSPINVPSPLKTIDGDYLTISSIEGVLEPRICTVFEWVQGKTFEDITPELAFEWGKISAHLHEHAKTFTPPAGFTRVTNNSAFPFPSHVLVLFEEENEAFVTDHALFKQALEKVNADIKSLFEAEEKPRILHGDLHLWNLMHHKGQFTVIDFEDMMWGYPVQDIGISLYYVRAYYNDALTEQFRRGYEHITHWPDKTGTQVATGIMARSLNISTWFYRNKSGRWLIGLNVGLSSVKRSSLTWRSRIAIFL